MRRRLAVGVAVVAALALPTSAFAHATLTHRSPDYQSRQAVAPRDVVLRFDQSVELIPHSVEMFAVDARKVSGTPVFRADHPTVRVRPQGPGRRGYTVRSRALSSRRHVG